MKKIDKKLFLNNLKVKKNLIKTFLFSAKSKYPNINKSKKNLR